MSDDIIRLMCARVNGKPLLIADNLTGPCSECWSLVQFRPHAPSPRILICMQCAAGLIEPGDTITTTPRMIEDAKEYFRKKLS